LAAHAQQIHSAVQANAQAVFAAGVKEQIATGIAIA